MASADVQSSLAASDADELEASHPVGSHVEHEHLEPVDQETLK